MLALIQSLQRDAWELVRGRLLLAVLEGQRAGKNITRIIFGGVVAAILLVTGWLALVASAMFWIVAADASRARAFLAVGVLHAALSQRRAPSPDRTTSAPAVTPFPPQPA